MTEVVLQYFDGCPNWQTTYRLLLALQAEAGFALALHRIGSGDEAQAAGFRGSPTVLIDGRDPFATPDAPVGLACRIYRTPAGPSGSPTAGQLRGALGLAPQGATGAR